MPRARASRCARPGHPCPTPRSCRCSSRTMNGTVQPVAELAAITRASGAAMHTDAVQAAGGCRFARELGCGCALTRRAQGWRPEGHGAARRSGADSARARAARRRTGTRRRSGTENVAGAPSDSRSPCGSPKPSARMLRSVSGARAELVARVAADVPGVVLTGDPAARPLPVPSRLCSLGRAARRCCSSSSVTG